MLRMNNLSISALDRKLIASLRLAFETEEVVSAAKVDDYKAKNPELADAIQTLNDELNRKKLQKHMAWSVKQLQAGEDVTSILEALDEFELLLKKRRGVGDVDPITRKRETEPFLKGSERDIFFYKKLKDLTDKIGEANQAVEERDVEEISKEEARKKIRQEGVEYIYHDADFLVARPLTKKASCHYGMGTKWCISDPEKDYFEMYSKENRYFFFVIDRSKDASGLAVPDYNKPDAKVNDPWAKVAFVFEKGNPEFLQAWDTPDKQISIPRVLNHYTKEYGRKIYDLIHLMYKSVESLPNTWQYELKQLDLGRQVDPQRVIEILKDHGEGNEDVRVAIAKGRDLTLDIQLLLVKDESVKVRETLAANSRIADEVKEILASDENDNVRASLATSINLYDGDGKTSKVALLLAADKSEVVVAALTTSATRWHENRGYIPADILDIVLNSELANKIANKNEHYLGFFLKEARPDHLIRVLQLNPNAAEVVVALPVADDAVLDAALATGKVPSWKVDAVMRKLTLTPERAERLLSEGSPENKEQNRQKMAMSEKATAEILDLVADAGPISENLAVLLANNKNASTGLLSRLLAVPDERGIISNKIASRHILTDEQARALFNKEIAPSARRLVDISLAANGGTPADVLSGIQSRTNNENDGYFEVRKELAYNNNTPSETLEAMVQQLDADSLAGSMYNKADVYGKVIKNVSTSAETRRRLVERVLSGEIPASVSEAIASSPLVPVDLLERIAKQFMWRAATALAKNPSSTPEILLGVFNNYSSGVRRHGERLEKVMSNPNFPLAKLLELAAKPGTRLGKHAKEVLKERPDRPAPPKRGRKPKTSVEPIAEAPMAAEEVAGVEAAYLKDAVHNLAEIFHLLPVSAFAVLAIEEAALLLEE